MFRKSLISLPLLAATSIPAVAGNTDLVLAEPVLAPAVVAPVYSFAGGYVGIQGGFADINANDRDTDGDGDDDDDDDDDGIDLEGDSGFLGLRSGYDFAFGNAIVGGLLQYDRMSGDLELDDGTDADVELESVLRAGLRGGYAFGPTMVYGTGGYARADTDNAGNADGYFVGVGLERFVTPKITLGGEILHHEFEDFGDTDADGDATTFGLNLNYRF